MLKDYHKLVEAWITPEQEILTKHFCHFGPVPERLYPQVKDEKWRVALQMASKMAEIEVSDRPELRLGVWGEELGKAAMELLSGMTNLDPASRPTIDQVLALPYWREGDS